MTMSLQQNTYEAGNDWNSSLAQRHSCEHYYSGQKASSGAASLRKVVMVLGRSWKEGVGDTRSGQRSHEWQETRVELCFNQ